MHTIPKRKYTPNNTVTTVSRPLSGPGSIYSQKAESKNQPADYQL